MKTGSRFGLTAPGWQVPRHTLPKVRRSKDVASRSHEPIFPHLPSCPQPPAIILDFFSMVSESGSPRKACPASAGCPSGFWPPLSLVSPVRANAYCHEVASVTAHATHPRNDWPFACHPHTTVKGVKFTDGWTRPVECCAHPRLIASRAPNVFVCSCISFPISDLLAARWVTMDLARSR